MAIYRNRTTGDLVDVWLHSSQEDNFTVAFPNWLHKVWTDGLAFTKEDGSDWLKTDQGDVAIPDGSYIVRIAGGALAVISAADLGDDYGYEG